MIPCKRCKEQRKRQPGWVASFSSLFHEDDGTGLLAPGQHRGDLGEGEDEKQNKKRKRNKKEPRRSSRPKKEGKKSSKGKETKKNTKEEAALKKKQIFLIQRNTNDLSKRTKILKNIKNVGSLER